MPEDEFFGDLLREVEVAERLKNRREEKLKKRALPNPDALVITQIRVKCRCGEIWEVPNSRLLLRYGKDRKRFKTFLLEYNNLPRELYVWEGTAPGCSKCYANAFWPTGEVETDK